MESFYDKELGVAWGPITKEEMLDDLLVYGPKIVKNRKTLGCNPTFEDKHSRYDDLDTESQEDFITQDNELIVFPSDEEFIEYNIPIKTNTDINTSYNDSCVSSDLKQFRDFSLENYKIDVDNCVVNQLDEDDFPIKTTNTDLNTSYDEGCFSSDIKQLGDSSRKSYKIDVDNCEVNHLDVKDRLPTPANLDEDTYDEICDNDEKNNDNEEKSILDVIEARLSPDPNEDPSSCNETSKLEKRILDIIETRLSLENKEDPSTSHDKSNLDKQDISDLNIQLTPEASASELPSDEDVFNDTLAEMERLLNQQELNDASKIDNMKTEVENICSQYNSCHTQSLCNEKSIVMTPRAVGLVNQNFEYASHVDDISSGTCNLSLEEEPRSLSSISGEISSRKLTPMVLLSNTKPNNTMKSGLPIYNRKGAINKAMISNNNARSPILSENIHSQNIKSTLTPTNYKQQFLQPVPKPTSSRKRFKNVESPVSRYIKNAGTTPLFQKVTPSKPLSCERPTVKVIKSCSKENSLIFPEVVYKPAKHAIVSKEKVWKMPNNIESLIPHKPNVIKHVGRIGQSSREKISKRLLEEDLTVNSSLNTTTTEDTSIHFAKTTYIS